MIRIAIDGPVEAQEEARSLNRLPATFPSSMLIPVRCTAPSVCMCCVKTLIPKNARTGLWLSAQHPHRHLLIDRQAGQRIFLNDEDVSGQIRSPQASMAAS